MAHGIKWNYEWEDMALNDDAICKGIIEFILDEMEEESEREI